MFITDYKELGKGCTQNFVEIVSLIAPHHVTGDKKEAPSWDNNPKVLEKSVAGFLCHEE